MTPSPGIRTGFREAARVRARQLRARLTHATGSEWVRNLLLLLIFLGFMVSLAYLFTRLFTEFLTIPMLGRYMMLQTLSLVFMSFFVLLLFSSMVTTLGTQFLSDDLPLLFATPLSARTIYWIKWVEGLFHATWMVFVFGYPVLVSYGLSTAAPWYFYPAAAVVLVPFVLVAFSLGNFAVNAILYWIPVQRVRAVLIGVGIAFGAVMVYVLRLMRPRILFEPELAREIFSTFLASFRIGRFTGLPSFHAAYFLHEMTMSRPGELLWHAVWLVGLAGLSLLVFGGLSGRWYGFSWVRTREGRPGEGHWITLRGLKGFFDRLPRPYGAFGRKETVLFLRQTTQWSQMLVLLGIVAVHVVNLLELPATDPLLIHGIYFFNIALIGFILAAICVRFVFPTISFEGPHFWIVRSAPVSMFQYFLHKMFFYLVPVGLLGGGLILLTNALLSIGWGLWGWSVLMVGVMSLTLTSGALAFGAVFPRFNYEHFGEIVTSAGSILYMLSAMFYVGTVVGLILVPLYYQLPRISRQAPPDLSGVPLAVGLVSGGSLVLAAGLLWVASRAVRDYEFSSL